MKKTHNSCKSVDSSEDAINLTSTVAPLRRGRRFSGLKIKTAKSRFMPRQKTYTIEDDYVLDKILGHGAYSSVKMAINKATDQLVAIKICRGTTSTEMLKEEYKILSNLYEDNVINVLDFKEDGDSEAYMVMEYFDGITMDEYICTNGTVSEAKSKEIVAQLLETLKNLHEEGITHCDIKPENILINDENKVKLIDFNISRAATPSTMSVDSDKNKSGSFFSSQLSSPLYAAPEIKMHKAYSESIDIWGVGIVLFSLLLGTLKSHYLHEISDAQERAAKLRSLVKTNEAMSDETKELLLSFLTNEGEDRPSASDALQHNWLKH